MSVICEYKAGKGMFNRSHEHLLQIKINDNEDGASSPSFKLEDKQEELVFAWEVLSET